jgi:hypothetical protein
MIASPSPNPQLSATQAAINQSGFQTAVAPGYTPSLGSSTQGPYLADVGPIPTHPVDPMSSIPYTLARGVVGRHDKGKKRTCIDAPLYTVT